MIRNVVLKKTLKNFIFPFISLLNQIIPKNDHWVLIYSANKGIQHSLLPLRQYLMDNGFSNKYTIICGIEHMKYVTFLKIVSQSIFILLIFMFVKSSSDY